MCSECLVKANLLPKNNISRYIRDLPLKVDKTLKSDN